jgi:tetratricopeptide (TPR) repeat protein
MFTPLSRLLLLLLCAALSVTAAVYGIWSLLFIATIGSTILLWGYFRTGSVKLALAKIRTEEYEEAEKVIGHTTNPERLTKEQKAYYLFVKGFIARHKDNFEEARIYLEECLDGGLKNQNDIAMALLALTDMEMVKKNKGKAKEYFLQMKDLKVKPSLMPSIRKMQEWIGV